MAQDRMTVCSSTAGKSAILCQKSQVSMITQTSTRHWHGRPQRAVTKNQSVAIGSLYTETQPQVCTNPSPPCTQVSTHSQHASHHTRSCMLQHVYTMTCQCGTSALQTSCAWGNTACRHVPSPPCWGNVITMSLDDPFINLGEFCNVLFN